jgi:hypothetical protein
MKIEIVPGHIRHRYRYYNYITDISAAFRGFNIDLDDTSLLNGEIELVTYERKDTKIIITLYRIMTAEN